MGESSNLKKITKNHRKRQARIKRVDRLEARTSFCLSLQRRIWQLCCLKDI